MKTATLTVSPNPKSEKLRIEIDVEQWERIASSLGLFSKEFLESLGRAEREIAHGRGRRLKSLDNLNRN
jgi:hypothetical protein